MAGISARALRAHFPSRTFAPPDSHPLPPLHASQPSGQAKPVCVHCHEVYLVSASDASDPGSFFTASRERSGNA